MMTDAPKKTAAMSRGWRIVLIASLGLNLAIAGLMGGAALKHGGPSRANERGDPLVRALDKSSRHELGREIREQRESRSEKRQELKAVFAEMLNVLRAETFDASAMRAVMERKSAVLESSRDFGEAALVAHLARLSTEDRAAFADRLEDMLARRKH